MPPLSPWQTVPQPAPTSPSSKSLRASAIAASTCSPVTGRSAISFMPESLHSPTTGLIECIGTPSCAQRTAI